ncbi:coenzyme Q biosynthesis protein Coq4-domain-containing protein [Russula earlei]|uniref:Coenzyme Q biosynthesis protein Coq4-domain-containing protein n=1 Tax=Russula earlei TaxID=71964 RepID=A0ACC0U6I9_9AGAM|nr:coenzyme Q biosynthesis protein Coq4-domain-containing protein [Russula earlei]
MSLLAAARSRIPQRSLHLIVLTASLLRGPEPAYPGHIPLTAFQNAFLAIGSAFMSLADPRRAALGETTAGPNTFGRTYVTWLERCGVTPDTREPVHYIDDPELAYVMQRYRECHDFYHALCGLPVSVEYELALKVFEFANLGLPSAALSTAAVVRLNAAKRARFLSEYVPWALRCGSAAQSMITVYWEERWAQDLEELKKELGVWDPPPPKWRKPLSEAKESTVRKVKEGDE